MEKNKKKSSSLTLGSLPSLSSLSQFLKPLQTHATLVMTLIALGILIFAFLLVQSILSQPADQTYYDQQATNRVTTQFDADTIKKIDNLKASSEGSAISLPDGRRNPFQ